MPEIIDSASVTWSESNDELSATATGRVTGVTVDDDGTIGSESDTDAITIAANGDVTVSQDLVVSGGVYLGGTAAANLLDDYEEGTWTPEYNLQGGTISSITYDVDTTGLYRKVGTIVYVQGYIATDAISLGGETGDIYIDNLPFAPQNLTGKLDEAALILVSRSQFWTTLPDRGRVNPSNGFYLINSNTELSESAFDTSGGVNENGLWFAATYTTTT